MRIHSAVVMTLAAVVVSSCGETATAPVPPGPAPAVAGMLRDIEISRLPSPYYHFEYDATGRVSAASFASGISMYDVVYADDRIAELQDNAPGTGDRLVYGYDDAGRVGTVRYLDDAGVEYTVVRFSYDGQKLTGVERSRRLAGALVVDKTVTLSYDADGNLRDLVEHRLPIEGRQNETTTSDRFEQYDDGINVDGFSLLHSEFFDHLVLLPGVQLQNGNPGRVTRTGDGVNYTIEYTYVYSDGNRPLTKTGDVTLLNGPNAGERFQTRSEFSYY